MADIVPVDRLPACDFCGEQAHYDGKTVLGSWAYMCSACFAVHGVGLGTGCGQVLVPREKTEMSRQELRARYKEWVKSLSEDELEEMAMDDVVVLEPCGCTVEPDGRCPHGLPSPLLTLGVI